MLTVILIAAAAILLVGLVWLVMQSGTKGNRQGQSGIAAANQQTSQPTPPRAQSTSSSSANN